MMSPATGPSVKVNGNSTAAPAVGPSPGSTPTIVPARQPMSAAMRFSGVRTTSNP